MHPHPPSPLALAGAALALLAAWLWLPPAPRRTARSGPPPAAWVRADVPAGERAAVTARAEAGRTARVVTVR